MVTPNNRRSAWEGKFDLQFFSQKKMDQGFKKGKKGLPKNGLSISSLDPKTAQRENKYTHLTSSR